MLIPTEFEGYYRKMFTLIEFGCKITVMTTKTTYTVKRAYTMSRSGVEKTVWYIMDGDFVVDVCDLKRDAKYYCDLWNKE